MTMISIRLRHALGFTVLCTSAQAALIWNSGFENYNTTGGAVTLTINATGDDNTFTAATPNANLASPVQEVRGTGVPDFMSGNALYIGGTSTGGSVSFALQQNAITTVGASGVLIASFDLYNTSASIVSTSAEARTVSGRSGITTYSSSTPVETAFRITIVLNKTGSAITLPGTLGSLATDSIAIYRFDGTSYSGLTTSTGLGNNITGFATGFSLSSSVVGSAYGLWLDNFGVWNSMSDTINGTSVLSLAPGTFSSIPEPASAATLTGAAAVGLLALRRNVSR